jgi:hypothetical protein
LAAQAGQRKLRQGGPLNSDIRLTKTEFAVLKALDDEGPKSVEGASFDQVVSASSQARHEALDRKEAARA